jgi:hypothetical protein
MHGFIQIQTILYFLKSWLLVMVALPCEKKDWSE